MLQTNPGSLVTSDRGNPACSDLSQAVSSPPVRPPQPKLASTEAFCALGMPGWPPPPEPPLLPGRAAPVDAASAADAPRRAAPTATPPATATPSTREAVISQPAGGP